MIAAAAACDAACVAGHVHEDIAWIDAQLAVPVERPAVRVATCAAPAVVLGRGQSPTAADRARAAAAGVDLVVRQSGGGAVLAGPWMAGASIALPPAHPFSALPPAASYRWLGETLVRGLETMGVVACALPLEARPRAAGTGWACFAQTSWWEVQSGGRKIAGLAQVRRRHGVVFVAGVLLAVPPWPLLCAVLGKPHADADALAAATVSVEELLARPVLSAQAVRELRRRIVAALD